MKVRGKGLRTWAIRLARPLLTVCVGYLVLCVSAALLRDRLVFPVRTQLPAGDFAPAGARTVWMRPEPDVQVEGWFFPAHEADGASSAAVLFFHGNGDRIDWHKETARIYTERGISVLLAGYRGYGRSSGSPSVDKVRSDAAAWYDLLAKQPEVDAGRILVHGYSLGSAFAAQAADQRPVLGVILESPFSSLKSMARHRWIYLYLARERLDTASIVSRHDWPVLILHGTRDTVVPYSEGVRVAEAAQDRGQFESFDAQHDVGSADWNRYEQLVSGFTAEQVAVAAERKR